MILMIRCYDDDNDSARFLIAAARLLGCWWVVLSAWWDGNGPTKIKIYPPGGGELRPFC